MIDVRAAIEEVRVRESDEAYWRALERILGTMTARTLRMTLRAKVGDAGLTDRDRVSRGLSDLFAYQARTVEDLAERETTLKAPRPREEELKDLGLHEHWADFSPSQDEVDRALPFVERGLARGAKVIALIPSEDAERYQDGAVRAGHGEDLRQGRFAIFSASEHVDVLRTAGVLAVVFLAVQGFIQGARGQGYPEVWFISKIAPLLLTSSPEYGELVLRFEAALDAFTRGFPTTVYCPFPEALPIDTATLSQMLHGHTHASVAEIAVGVVPEKR